MNFGICIVSHGIFPMCQFQNSFFHIFIWRWLKLQPIMTLKLYCKRLLSQGLRNLNSFEPGLRRTSRNHGMVSIRGHHMNPVHLSPDFKIRCLVMIYGENYQSNPKCFELENMLNFKKFRITDKKI